MIKNIIWDFDGVIINSEKVRIEGFIKSLKPYGDKSEIQKLIEYHNRNGGLSRYNKINYFFSSILNQKISNETLDNILKEFNKIMLTKLNNKNLLIKEPLNFISNQYLNINFHIASGSDETELNEICMKLDINKYFISICGSPTPKNQLVKSILMEYNYKKNETILIGDSINDFEAAKKNGIKFIGYNNELLKGITSQYYLSSFKNINLLINQLSKQ